jgi:Family of unknown function (DUF7002)
VNVDDFLLRCPTLWHIGAEGSWEGIKRHGFRTAEQLILAADLDEAARERLMTEPRPEPVTFTVDGTTVTLSGQQQLLKRADLGSLMDDGMTIADWIGVLNQRVYLFTDVVAMKKALARNLELSGAQELITFSPLKFIEACRPRVELSAQSSGAIARATSTKKRKDTFVSVGLFPGSKRPSEVTVVDGIDDLSTVAFVERHDLDGTKTALLR